MNLCEVLYNNRVNKPHVSSLIDLILLCDSIYVLVVPTQAAHALMGILIRKTSFSHDSLCIKSITSLNPCLCFCECSINLANIIMQWGISPHSHLSTLLGWYPLYGSSRPFRAGAPVSGLRRLVVVTECWNGGLDISHCNRHHAVISRNNRAKQTELNQF